MYPSTKTSLLALLLVSGCVGKDELPSSAARPSFVSYTDAHGRVWEATRPVEYDERGGDEAPWVIDEEAESKLSPEPGTVSDDEWAQLWKPISEFGGWEYELNEESLHNYGAELRASALRRAERPGELAESDGSGPPPDAVLAPPADQSARDKAVVGADDRTYLSKDWRAIWPYSMHGAMESQPAPNTVSHCTAFKVINQYTGGTAAHCLHNGSKWEARHDIEFHDGSKGVVNKNCYIRTVGSGWASGLKLPREDYAVLQFSTSGGTAWCTESTYNVGWFGTQSVGYTNEITGYVSGFPGEFLPTGTPWGTLAYHERGGAEVSTTRPKILLHENDAVGGQSGTPFVTRSFYRTSDGRWVWPPEGQRIRAIHKGDVFGEWNQGREFDGDILDFFRAHQGLAKYTGTRPPPIEPVPVCPVGRICQQP